MKILKHLRAILLLPVMVTLVVPGLLLFTGPGEFLWPPLHPVLVGVGLILGGLGLVLVVSTNLLFAKIGQ
jgi:hypothetical protein